MSPTPIPGFITKKETAELFQRSHRQLPRDLADAVAGRKPFFCLIDMVANGCVADVEQGGDFLVLVALNDEADDLGLPWRRFAGLVRHRVPWIQESDERSALTANPAVTVIEQFEF
jgi:hypothetical protein